MKIKDHLRRQLESYLATVKSKGTVQSWKKHLRSWPAYAAAGASSLAIVSSAGAGIISSGPINVTVTPFGGPFPSSAQVRIGSASFSELAQGTNNLPRRAFGFLQVNMHPNSSKGNLIDRAFSTGATDLQPKRFSSGAVISQNVPGERFVFGNVALKSFDSRFGQSTRGTWPVNQPGFIGIELNQPDGIHEGWVKLQWAADADGFPYSETILGWAYNDVAGASIRAGEVPEPGTITIALLAAGSAGVLAWRRKRKEQAAAAETAS